MRGASLPPSPTHTLTPLSFYTDTHLHTGPAFPSPLRRVSSSSSSVVVVGMVRVMPFKAYRPPALLASTVAAPPYDVINSDEARKLADGKESSFLRVNKPEIDLPASLSPYDLRVYERGAKNLQEFISRGWLKKDDAPSYYIYAQRMGDHLQHGICGACSVEEYATGVIKRHEKTQVKKENDRTRLTYTQNANVGPVFIMYKPHEGLDSLVTSVTSTRAPETSFIAGDDGIEHLVWPISDEPTVSAIRRAFESVRYTYIADGHHRSASAFRVGEMKIKEAIAAGQNVTGDESFCFFLAVLFPADQLKILEYNRVVKDLNGLTEEEFLGKVSEHFEVRKLTVAPAVGTGNGGGEEGHSPAAKGEVGMCLRGTWYRLTAREASVPRKDPVNSLDVQVLYNHVLASVLGIGDPREDERIKYVGGVRGTEELERLVEGERAWGAVAFAMFPVTVEEVMEIADAEGLMPPKATWFEPKLRSGLIVRLYDDS